MPAVFTPYSRKNSNFGRKLDAALSGQGRAGWLDWTDIPHPAEANGIRALARFAQSVLYQGMR